jgi:cysteine desulfurase
VTSRRHYLDHASTTPIRPDALQAMTEWLAEAGTPDGVGDPGRLHEEGRRARMAVESSRETVAARLGTEASRVVFTSGATEAANAAVFSATSSRGDAPVLSAGVEHSCVREACRRTGRLIEIPVHSTGCLDVDAIAELLLRERPALVNCQFANHEVGTLQPLLEIVALCRQYGVAVHCDAAAAGHAGLSFEDLGVDYMSVSAHKLGGPPGVGALVVRRGIRLAPFLVGGSEERARRAGAENVLGIVGFAGACRALDDVALADEAAAAQRFTGRLEAMAMAVPGVEVVGRGAARLAHIVCLSIAGVLGEAVLLSLDRNGIAAHSGSACSSEVLEPSPVLAAMGVDPDSSLRLSVGWSTKEDDIEAFGAVFADAVARLRSLGASADPAASLVGPT